MWSKTTLRNSLIELCVFGCHFRWHCYSCIKINIHDLFPFIYKHNWFGIQTWENTTLKGTSWQAYTTFHSLQGFLIFTWALALNKNNWGRNQLSNLKKMSNELLPHSVVVVAVHREGTLLRRSLMWGIWPVFLICHESEFFKVP